MKYIDTQDGPVCPDCYHPAPDSRCDCRASARSLLCEQKELIEELIENDIRKHSVEAINPMVQAWADGRVELAKETLAAFRENASEHPTKMAALLETKTNPNHERQS